MKIQNLKPIPLGNNIICKKANIDIVSKNGIMLPINNNIEFFEVVNVPHKTKDIKNKDIIVVHKNTATNFLFDYYIVDKYQILSIYRLKNK